jgi:hypothetical protein
MWRCLVIRVALAAILNELVYHELTSPVSRSASVVGRTLRNFARLWAEEAENLKSRTRMAYSSKETHRRFHSPAYFELSADV